jgi:hypothetical protein
MPNLNLNEMDFRRRELKTNAIETRQQHYRELMDGSGIDPEPIMSSNNLERKGY